MKKQITNEFFKKAAIILIPLILFSIFGFVNRKICFEIIQFSLSVMLAECNLIDNQTIRTFIKTLPVLTYAALFYDVLVESQLVPKYYVLFGNIPGLAACIIAAINYSLINKCEFLEENNLSNVPLNVKSSEMISYFFKHYIHRIKSIWNNFKYILTLNLILALIFTLGCIFHKQSNDLYTETTSMTFHYIAIYWIIDVLVYIV